MSEKCWSFRDWPKTKNGNSWNIDMVGYNSDLGKNSKVSTLNFSPLAPNDMNWGLAMTVFDLE